MGNWSAIAPRVSARLGLPSSHPLGPCDVDALWQVGAPPTPQCPWCACRSSASKQQQLKSWQHVADEVKHCHRMVDPALLASGCALGACQHGLSLHAVSHNSLGEGTCSYGKLLIVLWHRVAVQLCSFVSGLLGRTDGACSVFSPKEARLLEWLEDVRLWEVQGYGAAINYEIAAPLMADIVRSLKVGATTSMFSCDNVQSHALPVKAEAACRISF